MGAEQVPQGENYNFEALPEGYVPTFPEAQPKSQEEAAAMIAAFERAQAEKLREQTREMVEGL